jgi:hypothetical protein
MRTLCGPAFRVLALVVALPLVGCLNEGVFYSPGELPGFGEPAAGKAECELEVDGASPVGAGDSRSAIAGLPGGGARAPVAGVRPATRAGFTTSSCESSVTDR